MRRFLRWAAPAAILGSIATPAFAQYAAADSGDTGWMLACGMLAMLAAIPGSMLWHAGRVQAKNALSVMAQGLGVAATVSLVWAIIGYSLAYAPGDAYLGGAANLLLANLGDIREGLTVPESAFVLLQMALAILAATLVIGGVAERVRFAWLMIFAPAWVLVVYAPIARWVWGGGWLSSLGVMDFSGALVVNLCGGVSALVAAMMIGKRTETVFRTPPAHARVLSLGGIGLIWVGWFGISGGWSLAATDNAATAIINTHLAAAGAALAWASVEWLRNRRTSATGIAAGGLSGLVAISASAGLVGTGGAIIIGIVSGILCQLSGPLARRLFRADDALDGFVVHGIGGIVGALLLVPFITLPLGGIGLDPKADLVALMVAQLIGISVVILWSAVGTAIIGFAISMIIPLRVIETDEQEGLDATHHGQRGWDFG